MVIFIDKRRLQSDKSMFTFLYFQVRARNKYEGKWSDWAENGE